MIHLDHLTKTFILKGQRRTVADDITATVAIDIAEPESMPASFTRQLVANPSGIAA